MKMLFVFIINIFVSNLNAMDGTSENRELVSNEFIDERILISFIQNIHIKNHWYSLLEEERSYEINFIQKTLKVSY